MIERLLCRTRNHRIQIPVAEQNCYRRFHNFIHIFYILILYTYVNELSLARGTVWN